MKLLSINVYYCLLHFDALNFFLGSRLHGESQPNFNFFNVNHQIFQQNLKVYLTKYLETNFHNISNISLRVIICRNFNKKVFSFKISGVGEESINFIHNRVLRRKNFLI